MAAGVSIRLEHCSKTYPNGYRALDPIELTVAAGEMLAVLGPSGCGKTTVLRIIAGLEQPDPGGRVFIGDSEVTEVPTERRGVGMVFQNYALFPNLSLADNIGYGLKVRRLDPARRRQRVTDLLAMLHLTEFANRPVQQLSGGQKQRVALGRALAPEPRVLLLDEPLTALDAKLRDALRVELAELLGRLQITTVLVTHDQAEAMALGHRVAVMSRRRVEQIGSPQELYGMPHNVFVADFVGTMNRVNARQVDGRIVLGGEQPLYFRPHDVALASAQAAEVTGLVVGSFFAGSVTRVIVRLDDGQMVTIDALGPTRVTAGAPVGVVFSRPTAIGDL
jgi:putative spermidine/putrescine transport system ATP-binding protein